MQSMIASNLHFVYVRALFHLAYQAFLLMVSTVIITVEFFTNLIELHWGFFSFTSELYIVNLYSMVLYFLLKKFPPVECLQEYVHVRITAIEDCINFIVTRWKWIKCFDDAKLQLEFYTICNVTADLILLVQDF